MRVRGYCNLEAGACGGCVVPTYVRFTPESGHVRCSSRCLLWANSRDLFDFRDLKRRSLERLAEGEVDCSSLTHWAKVQFLSAPCFS
jgi:hypothetical protein